MGHLVLNIDCTLYFYYLWSDHPVTSTTLWLFVAASLAKIQSCSAAMIDRPIMQELELTQARFCLHHFPRIYKAPVRLTFTLLFEASACFDSCQAAPMLSFKSTHSRICTVSTPAPPHSAKILGSPNSISSGRS